MDTTSKRKSSYLDAVEHLADFGGIFHFEEGAQVSRRVVELYLETFVSKSDLAARSQWNHCNDKEKKSDAIILHLKIAAFC